MKKGLIEVLFYIVLVFGVSFLLTNLCRSAYAGKWRVDVSDAA